MMTYIELFDYLDGAMYHDKGFQQSLMEHHASEYTGLDDDMSDAFDEWYSERDPAEIVQDYFDYLHNEAKKKTSIHLSNLCPITAPTTSK